MEPFPRLEAISIKGYKSLANVEKLKLGSLNILIGPNGSGKSNLISFFRMLKCVAKSDDELRIFVEREGRASSLLHDGPSVTSSIECDISFNCDGKTTEGGYRFKLGYGGEDALFPFDERSKLTINKPESFNVNDDKKIFHGIRETKEWIGKFGIYQFHNTSLHSRFKQFWPISDGSYIKDDGGNIVSVLYYLREKHNAYYNKISDTIAQIVPFFDNFEFQPDSNNKLYLSWREKGTDCIFGAHQASDGMLRTIALVTLLCLPKDMLPSLVILDEPELGLHPFAITVIAGLIKSVSRKRQVILATQSTLLLDHFEADDVIVAERHGRITNFKRLSSEELKSWLEDYSLSEIWCSNLFGGRP
jgi:predicted ATPase